MLSNMSILWALFLTTSIEIVWSNVDEIIMESSPMPQV